MLFDRIPIEDPYRYLQETFQVGLDLLPKFPSLNCSPLLDHATAEFPACSTKGGPCADDLLTTSIGGLLPIALWDRSSL
jgi:hypothetical protein